MEVAIEMDLLVVEQAMLVECFEVYGQLVVEDIVDMFVDTADMTEDTVDMADDIVGMIEDIVEMISIVVVDKFNVAMAWEHSKNSEHTSDLV